jgi:heme/copper-type cytochrome/quinol oxidase subunit 4
MIKREIFIGFVVGIISNGLGILIALQGLAFYAKLSFKTTYEVAYSQGNMGNIIALGGILNMVSFFLFLHLNRDYRARGVLMASVLAAILILIYKVM